MPLSFPGSAQQTGYFLGLPRLCDFTGTSFVLGVQSSGLERLWPEILTGFAPGLAIISSECLNASTITASQQSGNVGRVYKIGRLRLPSGGHRGGRCRPGLAFFGTGAKPGDRRAFAGKRFDPLPGQALRRLQIVLHQLFGRQDLPTGKWPMYWPIMPAYILRSASQPSENWPFTRSSSFRLGPG